MKPTWYSWNNATWSLYIVGIDSLIFARIFAICSHATGFQFSCNFWYKNNPGPHKEGSPNIKFVQHWYYIAHINTRHWLIRIILNTFVLFMPWICLRGLWNPFVHVGLHCSDLQQICNQLTDYPFFLKILPALTSMDIFKQPFKK